MEVHLLSTEEGPPAKLIEGQVKTPDCSIIYC